MTDDTNIPPARLAPLAAILAEVDTESVSASVAAHAIEQAATASAETGTRSLPTVTSGTTGITRTLTLPEYRSGLDLRRQRRVLDTERAAEMAKVVETWQERRLERPEPLADRIDWNAPTEEIEAGLDEVAEEVFEQIHRATQIKRAHLTLMSGGTR